MEKQKRLRLSILSLLLALVVALSAAAFLLTGKPSAAYAADRYVELDGNTVFYTSIRGAGISESEEKSAEGDEETHRYTLFQIGENQTVAYRQNLAYAWKTGTKNEDGNYTRTEEAKTILSLRPRTAARLK